MLNTTLHPKALSSLHNPVHSSLSQAVLTWNLLVKTTQFHPRSTFWTSRLRMQSDTLKALLPASQPITPLHASHAHAHIFSISLGTASSSPACLCPHRPSRAPRHLRPHHSALASWLCRGTQRRILGVWFPRHRPAGTLGLQGSGETCKH